jgi:predicted TIM-barrel fold metal-dependent hydrolase
VRYEDLFPGSYDPAARVTEILEDGIDGEVIFNGVGTVWMGIKLCPDKALALACYKVYNDWIASFQAHAPARFVCNGTLPTTGLDDAIDELHRCAELGLRTVQLESYPSGSFSDPSPEDDRFWAAAVELGMPINVHTQFFFPVGDLGSRITSEGVKAGRERAQKLGLDVQAGSFPVILWRMMQTGVFERFPELKFVGSEVHTGWVPYYLERFDESVQRNRRDWNLPLLPTEYFRQNVSVVYIVDEVGAHNRYDIGVANMMWGPDFPHSSSAWPVDYELGLEILQRAGASESEVERIMWKNAADIYKVPYDAADAVSAAA